MRRFPSRCTFWSAGLTLLFFSLICWLLALQTHPPTIVVLPFGARPRPSAAQNLMSVWSWRLQRIFFGPAKPVNFRGTFLSLTNVMGLRLFPESGGSFVATNGLKIWLLSESDLERFRRHARERSGGELLGQPSVSTADGIQSRFSFTTSASIGGTNVNFGLSMDITPKVWKNSTEVTLSCLSTEFGQQIQHVAIETNFALEATLRIPKGSGALILQANNTRPDSKSFGVVLSVGRP